LGDALYRPKNTKFSGEKIMLSTIKNNEKFYLTFWEVALYTYCNPRKQKTFTPYSETEKFLGWNAFSLFFRGKGGVKRRTFVCRI